MNLFSRRCIVITTHRNRYWSTKSDNSYSQHSLRGGNRFPLLLCVQIIPLFSYIPAQKSMLINISLKWNLCKVWRGQWQKNDIVAKILSLRECTVRNSRDFQEEFPRLRFVSFWHFFFGSTKLINEKKVVKNKLLQIHTWSQRRCIQIYMISVEIQFSLILTEKLGGEGIKPSWITSKITLIHVIEILKIHVVKL